MAETRAESYAIFVGIDWALKLIKRARLMARAEWCWRDPSPHSGKGLADLFAALRGLVGGQAGQLAVAIEVPRGAIVETLLEKQIAVFALDPKQLDRTAPPILAGPGEAGVRHDARGGVGTS